MCVKIQRLGHLFVCLSWLFFSWLYHILLPFLKSSVIFFLHARNCVWKLCEDWSKCCFPRRGFDLSFLSQQLSWEKTVDFVDSIHLWFQMSQGWDVCLVYRVFLSRAWSCLLCALGLQETLFCLSSSACTSHTTKALIKTAMRRKQQKNTVFAFRNTPDLNLSRQPSKVLLLLSVLTELLCRSQPSSQPTHTRTHLSDASGRKKAVDLHSQKKQGDLSTLEFSSSRLSSFTLSIVIFKTYFAIHPASSVCRGGNNGLLRLSVS